MLRACCLDAARVLLGRCLGATCGIRSDAAWTRFGGLNAAWLLLGCCLGVAWLLLRRCSGAAWLLLGCCSGAASWARLGAPW
eukprot:9988350-Lingulodinium_polyedra.AAC.1